MAKKRPSESDDCDASNEGLSEPNADNEVDDSEADDEISNTEENEDENSCLTNSGWADSVSKILKTNKPKGKKTIVLSRAKKLTDLKKEKVAPAGFEVQTVDGEIKEENVQVKVDFIRHEEPSRKKRKTLADPRIKPNILEKDRERTLQKIATKGVVQLFNAVKLQQKQITQKLEEAGPLEVRKEKVLKNIDKRAFLDVLMGEKSEKVDDVTHKIKIDKENVNIKINESRDSLWSVLKDDFMLRAKMKDWDKDVDTDDVRKIPD